MLEKLFKGVFDISTSATISLKEFLLCIGFAIICGIILTVCYIVKARYTRSFAAALALLPAVVAVVIMMVNGNIGAGVAVAGAFSLVRFRSAAGTAREIAAIFLAMGTGLVCGMGYLGYAVLISLLLGGISLLYNLVGVKRASKRKTVRIMIPEDLDYTDVFEDVFNEFTLSHELVKVKTTNMGSLFRLTYDVTIKSGKSEKEFIDKLRVRNGNLEITVSNQETTVAEL